MYQTTTPLKACEHSVVGLSSRAELRFGLSAGRAKLSIRSSLKNRLNGSMRAMPIWNLEV